MAAIDEPVVLDPVALLTDPRFLLIDTEPEEVALARLRAAETTGRPLGSDDFVTRLEDLVQRRLRRRKPGRKARTTADAGDLFARMDEGPARPGNV
jgi:hypothetical protein